MTDAIVNKTPLEDVMVAMDVVDTLRHQQDVAARELDSESRRQRLLDRLRDMYLAQGIEVPDHVLKEGIEALEQERFQYQAVPISWQTRLAGIWVSRGRWGKPFGFLAVLASVFSGVYVVNDVLPERAIRSGLPDQLQSSLAAIESTASDPDVIAQARQRVTQAEQAIAREDFEAAKNVRDELHSVRDRLQRAYSIRVVSKPNQLSGIWRVPEVNQAGRNYYLIVEAIDRNNQVVELDILSEESNKRVRKKQWGLRVNETTFYKIAQDKKDDGIIQGNRVGEKRVGDLLATFSIPTTGATITDW